MAINSNKMAIDSPRLWQQSPAMSWTCQFQHLSLLISFHSQGSGLHGPDTKASALLQGNSSMQLSSQAGSQLLARHNLVSLGSVLGNFFFFLHQGKVYNSPQTLKITVIEMPDFSDSKGLAFRI